MALVMALQQVLLQATTPVLPIAQVRATTRVQPIARALLTAQALLTARAKLGLPTSVYLFTPRPFAMSLLTYGFYLNNYHQFLWHILIVPNVDVK